MAREKQNQPDHDTITAFVVAFVGMFSTDIVNVVGQKDIEARDYKEGVPV